MKKAERNSLATLAQQELGADHNCDWNESKTFALCKQLSQNNSDPGINDFYFIIYSQEENKIIRKERLVNAEIGWHSDDEVKITQIPGIVQDTPSPEIKSDLLNVRTGKKYPLTSEKL
jgi:hypothetical protein